MIAPTPWFERKFNFDFPIGMFPCILERLRGTEVRLGAMLAGVPTSITTIQGAAHAFDNNALDAVDVMAHSIDLFLDRLIVNPKPYPGFGGGGGGRGGRGGQGGGRGTGRD